MKMKKAVLVYEGVVYDELEFNLDARVEEIPLAPKDGWQLFTPGAVTYTIRLLDGRKFDTKVHPYRFTYQDTHYFVFHTI